MNLKKIINKQHMSQIIGVLLITIAFYFAGDWFGFLNIHPDNPDGFYALTVLLRTSITLSIGVFGGICIGRGLESPKSKTHTT